MNAQAGYTLIETVAALAVAAFAVGGITAGSQLLLRQQGSVDRAATTTQTARQAQFKLDRTLNRFAPFRAQNPAAFAGDDRAARFDCGGPDPCRITVSGDAPLATVTFASNSEQWSWTTRAAGRVHLVYEGSRDTGEVWPPPSGLSQPLKAVAIVDEAPRPVRLLEVKLWDEEPGVCAFDAVMQDCR